MRRVPLVLGLLGVAACGELPFDPVSPPIHSPLDLSQDKRAELLRMYVTEYEATSWIYQTERKKRFVELIARIGSDDATRFVVQECEKMGWDYHKNIRLFFIGALGKTDNDLAADYLMKEYDKYSWDYHNDRKVAILDALSQLAAGREPIRRPGG